METPDRSIEYLAGFLDADGCITIVATRPRTLQRGWTLSPSHRLRVIVVGVDPRPLIAFQRRWGGRVYRQPGAKPHHKVEWSWHLELRKGEPLQDMLPFLLVKQTEARLGLRFLRECGSGAGHRISEALLSRREWYRRAMQRLKQRETVQLPEDWSSGTASVRRQERGRRRAVGGTEGAAALLT